MRTRGRDTNTQAMIDKSVAAVYARAANLLAVAQNHSSVALAAASTVAIVGTSGAPTSVVRTDLIAKVTGKYRVTFTSVVTPLNTTAHKVTAILGFAQNTTSTAAINPFATGAQIFTMNPVGMPLTTAGTEGGACVTWTLETTAIGTPGANAAAFGVSMFGEDTTSLQVSGGGAQLTVDEIF